MLDPLGAAEGAGELRGADGMLGDAERGAGADGAALGRGAGAGDGGALLSMLLWLGTLGRGSGAALGRGTSLVALG